MSDLHLRKLRTENFRNLSSDIVEFSGGINCIFGSNGNGKTNLLEAVYYLLNRKSFRKNTDFSQILNIEGSQTEVQFSAVFERGVDELMSVSAKIHEGEQEWWVDNRPEKPKLPSAAIFVNPFDSYLFHTSATFRRQWLDIHLSQLDLEYKKTLGRFQKGLRQRNALLNMGPSSQNKLQLMALDEQFSEHSNWLVSRREEWLGQLNKFITPTFREIFSENHELVIDIESKFRGWSAKRIYEHYRNTENTDFAARHSTSGIHRDDCLFSFDGLNSFEFCSLGQQKMSFLSLMFAFIELFRYKLTFYPIVLIDDVSGELDSTRWKNLIHYLREKTFQVLITTANENFRMELEKIPHARRIFMEQGRPVSQG